MSFDAVKRFIGCACGALLLASPSQGQARPGEGRVQPPPVAPVEGASQLTPPPSRPRRPSGVPSPPGAPQDARPSRRLCEGCAGGAEAQPGGPTFELAYARYDLTDGFGGGTVNAGNIGVYLPSGSLRLGVIGELGTRRYALGSTDVLARGTLIAGYQYLHGWGALVPYAAAIATLGGVVGERFSTPVTYGLRGLGLETGFDLPFVSSAGVGVALSYVRARFQGLGHNLFILRLRLFA